jgi:hypothetical protein
VIKLDDENIKIESLSLPKEIQVSIGIRNSGGLNHIFEEKEIKVLCSRCKEYHPVFRLGDGNWDYVNKTYWQSKNKKDKQSYFGSKCTACYKNQNLKKEQYKNDYQQRLKELEPTVTRKGGGIPHSIVLSPELDMYLKLYCVTNKVKKNKLINILLEEFKQANPLNLP